MEIKDLGISTSPSSHRVWEYGDTLAVTKIKINWRNWKLMRMTIDQYPDTISGWLWLVWNADIFIGWFPVLKSFLLLCFLAAMLAVRLFGE